MRRVYSDEELLDKLKMFAEYLDKTPSALDFDKHGDELDMPSRGTYVQRFGFYAEACRRAGLDPNKKFPSSNSGSLKNDEILEDLRSFVKQVQSIPTVKEVDRHPNLPHSSSYRHKYGKWDNALIKAGVYEMDNVRSSFYSTNRIIYLLRHKIFSKNSFETSFNKLNGYLQEYDFINENAKPLSDLFDSVDDIYTALGISKEQRGYWFLIEEIFKNDTDKVDLKYYLDNFSKFKDWINIKLETLNKKESEVVRLYFIEDKTYREISEMPKFNFSSRERARQIRNKGIRKLREYKAELVEL